MSNLFVHIEYENAIFKEDFAYTWRNNFCTILLLVKQYCYCQNHALLRTLLGKQYCNANLAIN